MVPRYNIAPSQPLPIIRTPGRLELLPWGRKFINVRVERATTRSENRCLVVVDGFYEWRKPDKQPFYFHRVDGKPFALGGVTKGDEAAIATCPAREGVVELHDRMPVILRREDCRTWLDPATPPTTLHTLLAPCPAEWLFATPVSRAVNNPRNDSPACIEESPP